MIDNHKIAPLEKRVEILENEIDQRKTLRSPPKVEVKYEDEEQMHKRLLSEMKRKRLWYLRKTPQDHIIEELMLKHRCT